MCGEIFSILKMGCCGCFGFMKKTERSLVSVRAPGARLSQEFLLPPGEYGENDSFYMFEGEGDSFLNDCFHGNRKNFEEILQSRIKNGMTSRRVPVRETRQVVRSEDENGTKMINEYVRECKIGSGSYGKVVLHRSTKDGKQYAIKIFHKSHLMKLRVAPSETAMSDVLREVAIMKILDHPNVVRLVEVIDDPTSDHLYMVLEYVEGKWSGEGCGPRGGLGEDTSRRYLKDIVAGLIYLHANNIVHGDIKPDNLLVTSSGRVKIGDFSVSQVFEDDDDELRRSPGTPVFTAPECCQGLTYQGKVADTWAVGVTLYCMIFGQYPFLGETLQDTYDKIVNDPLLIPDEVNPLLKNLLEGLLCKDPRERLTLQVVAEHPWVVGEDEPDRGAGHDAEAARL